MEELQSIKKLLQEVSAISKKYEEIAKITGENYNIFNILGLSTKEVRTHSAFIADLLNPEGLHGQGSIFLELFFDQIKIKLNVEKEKIKSIEDTIKKIPSKKANVFVEENIGKISDDEGGRIDIVIKDSFKQIVIENKICADDEKRQLVRYKNKYPNALLLYLTLHEKEASDKSITKKDNSKLIIYEDYFNITYKEDIVRWLEKCKEKAVNQPILRETLTQYINLIKFLTGQTMNEKMENEIVKLLLNNNSNFNNAMTIIEAFDKIKKDTYDFLSDLLKKLGFAPKSNKPSNAKHFFYDNSNLYENDIASKFRFWTWLDGNILKIIFELYGEDIKYGEKVKDELLKYFHLTMSRI